MGTNLGDVDYEDGRYDEDSKALLLKYRSEADLVLVIVVGERCGFSVATPSKEYAAEIPKTLRNVANMIETSLDKQKYKIERL